MNLYSLLQRRQENQQPVRVAVIGCGKFASMFLSQAIRTPGLHIACICDLAPQRARQSLLAIGWTEGHLEATSIEAACQQGTTYISDDAASCIASGPIEIIIDATGDPLAGIFHASLSVEHGKHVIMVNVEADALAGPWLAKQAHQAGLVYSLAYGDQPALICEQVDWARTLGFDVVCAGKGTKYLPEYHASTPETVWEYYGLEPEQARLGGMNPKMFNSFLDGTKSAIEMAAVANATGLTAPTHGLQFPSCPAHLLPERLKPASAGGILEHKGMVEVVSCLDSNGDLLDDDLRWGVYVTFEASSDYVARCFNEYGLHTDTSGRYSTLYRKHHLIGLELGISVASIAIRNEATGYPREFNADVVATAKRDLSAGEMLDGEGGYCVWGKLMPASDSIKKNALPMGLTGGVKLTRSVAQNETLCFDDVQLDAQLPAVQIAKQMRHLAGTSATLSVDKP
jgi:predicted homoserine dehydrogenase-like protein